MPLVYKRSSNHGGVCSQVTVGYAKGPQKCNKSKCRRGEISDGQLRVTVTEKQKSGVFMKTVHYHFQCFAVQCQDHRRVKVHGVRDLEERDRNIVCNHFLNYDLT